MQPLPLERIKPVFNGEEVEYVRADIHARQVEAVRAEERRTVYKERNATYWADHITTKGGKK